MKKLITLIVLPFILFSQENNIESNYFKDKDSNSRYDFNGSSFLDLKPNNSLELRIGTTSSTFYGNVNPNSYNSRDLGSSSLRWRDIYTVGSVNTSDITYKKDVEDLELGLDFLNTLEPIQFKWDELGEVEAGIRTHAGFSAQDVEQKLIDFGVEAKDYAIFTNSQITESPDEDPIYGLRSNEFISILTKSIQELSTKVDDLTARIEVLEG